MNTLQDARSPADAVARFADNLSVKAPHSVSAKLDSPSGVELLCAVEAAIAAAWPAGVARELVWLTRGEPVGEALRLSAFDAQGGLLADATFRWS